MLIKLIMMPLLVLVKFIIGLLPVSSVSSSGFSGVLNVIGYGCAIIGTDFFLFILGNIIFWLNAQLLWSIIEWVYKKIPGIN